MYSILFSIYLKRPGQDKGERNTPVLVSSFDESVQGNVTDTNEEILEKLHQVFLDGLLSASNLSELVNNREKIHCFYQGKLDEIVSEMVYSQTCIK